MKQNGYQINPQAKLVIDMAGDAQMPKRFRKIGPSTVLPPEQGLDLSGFRELRFSGSGQFSLEALRQIRQQLGPLPITVIDLRQECHGFVNGMAVSLYSQENNDNRGLTDPEIHEMEHMMFQELGRSKEVTFFSWPGKSVCLRYPVEPDTICSEETIVQNEGMRYKRFNTLDHHRPTDDTVNRFVEYVLGQREQRWLHFHCRGGSGRTSTFMLMYDMMHNADRVSLDDILRRHILSGSRDMAELNSRLPVCAAAGAQRLEFLKQFYLYCKRSISRDFPSPFQTEP